MSASPASGPPPSSEKKKGIKPKIAKKPVNVKPKPKPKPAKKPANTKPKAKTSPKTANKSVNAKPKPKPGPKTAEKPVNSKSSKPITAPKPGKIGKNNHVAAKKTAAHARNTKVAPKSKNQGKLLKRAQRKKLGTMEVSEANLKLPVHKYIGHVEKIKHVPKVGLYDLKPHHLSFLAQGKIVHVNGKLYYPKPEFVKNGSGPMVQASHPIISGYSLSEESDQGEDEDSGEYSENNANLETDGVELEEDQEANGGEEKSTEEANGVEYEEIIGDGIEEENTEEPDGAENEESGEEEQSEGIEDPEALSRLISEASSKSPFGLESVVSLASTESEDRQKNSRSVIENTNKEPTANMKNKSETEEGSGEIYSFELDTQGSSVKNLVETLESISRKPASHSPASDEPLPSQPPREQSSLPDSKGLQNNANSELVSESKSVIPPQIVDFEVCDAEFEKHLQDRYGFPDTASENGSKVTGKRVGGEFDSSSRKRQRMERFGLDNNSSLSPFPLPANLHRNREFVGTSKALEKSFLRLTSEPIPSNVRPQEVLEDCLPFVLKRFYSEKLLYVYINDQLKAIRQDLTIQHKKNQFTMRVYQTHARIAIEHNDLGEFNQCLSQLFTLYEIDRAKYELPEFVVYKVLYMIITGNNPEINKLRLRFLGSDVEKMYSNNHFSKWIKPALELSSAIITGDYFSIFRLYRQFTDAQVPLASLLMKRNIIPKQRFMAFATMGKAFKRLSLAYLEEQLALNADGINTNKFLILHNLHMFIVGNDLDLSQAKPRILGLLEQGVFKRIDIKGQV